MGIFFKLLGHVHFLLGTKRVELVAGQFGRVGLDHRCRMRKRERERIIEFNTNAHVYKITLSSSFEPNTLVVREPGVWEPDRPLNVQI